jgi:hypothetical protein
MKKGIMFVVLTVVFVMAFGTVAYAAWPTAPTAWNFERDFGASVGPIMSTSPLAVTVGNPTGIVYDYRARTGRILTFQDYLGAYQFGAAGSGNIYKNKLPAVKGTLGDADWMAAYGSNAAYVTAIQSKLGEVYFAMADVAGPPAGVNGAGRNVYLQWWAVDADNPDNLVDITGNTGSPHGGYSTTTIKCAVCHNVHTAAPAQSASAPVADTLLRMKAEDACGFCHVAKGNTVGNPIWGGDVRALDGANGHALGTNCDECHTSVHGGGAEDEVACLEGKLLTLGTDYGTGSPGGGTTVLSRVGVIGNYATLQGFAPNATEATVTGFSYTDYQTKHEADAPGITQQAVGVFCGGCHDGSYALARSGASASTFGGRTSGMFSGHLSLAAAKTGSSWAPVAGCVSCHDASDGFGGYAFPHNWGTAGGEAIIDPATNDYENQSMGWLLSAPYFGAAKTVNGGPEGKLGHAGPNGGTLQDGICLKCHRGSADTGVGLTY